LSREGERRERRYQNELAVSCTFFVVFDVLKDADAPHDRRSTSVSSLSGACGFAQSVCNFNQGRRSSVYIQGLYYKLTLRDIAFVSVVLLDEKETEKLMDRFVFTWRWRRESLDGRRPFSLGGRHYGAPSGCGIYMKRAAMVLLMYTTSSSASNSFVERRS
jgi:hypothetical protein